MPLPTDPRGHELLKMLYTDAYERKLGADVEQLLLDAFNESADVLRAAPTLAAGHRAREVMSRINSILTTAYAQTSSYTRAQMAEFAVTEGQVATERLETLTQGLGVTLGEVTVPELRAIAALPIHGLDLGEWWDKQAASMTTATRQQLQLGIVAGEPNDQIARRLYNRADDTAPAVFRQARRNALAIVRTTTTAVSNEAAFKSYQSAGPDVSGKYQYLAVRDARTTPICRGLDGHEFPYKDGSPKPPQHINCRSTIVPVINYRGLKVRPPEKKGPLGFRSYDEWLREQPPAFQDQLLTKSRAQLWRDRKLTLGDLVGKDKRLLTLDQLQELVLKKDATNATMAAVRGAPKKPKVVVEPVPLGRLTPEQAIANVEAAYKQVEAARAEIQAIQLKADAIYAQMREMYSTAATDKAMDWATYGRLSEERLHLVSQMQLKRDGYNKVMWEAIKAPKPGELTFRGQKYGVLDWKSTPTREKGLQLFRELVGDEWLRGQQVAACSLPPNSRAFYSSFTRAIHVTTTDAPSTVAHELGHWLEQAYPKDKIYKFTEEWKLARARADGELNPTRLNQLLPGRGYSNDEVAYRDHFIMPYIGKVYGETASSWSNEVLTMGIQYMIDDPVMFWEKDPEMFKLILTILRRGP